MPMLVVAAIVCLWSALAVFFAALCALAARGDAVQIAAERDHRSCASERRVHGAGSQIRNKRTRGRTALHSG